MFWKSVHLFSIFKEEMGLFIIIIIYSHITELSVQYNAELQCVMVLICTLILTFVCLVP